MTEQTEPKVLIRGKVFLYRQKAPFEPSGLSVKGAIEFNEAEDTIRCHECGVWRRSLAKHVIKHKLTAAEYKQRHGLRGATALVCEGLRAVQIKRGRTLYANLTNPEADARRRANINHGVANRHSTEVKNEDGRCHAQILARLQEIKERVGHTPSIKDMAEAGLSHKSVLHSFNLTSLPDVMALLGLPPNLKSQAINKGRRVVWTKAIMIEMIRDFWAKHHRIPSPSDRRRGLFPNEETIRQRFGSMRALYEEAGFAFQIYKPNSIRTSQFTGPEALSRTGD